MNGTKRDQRGFIITLLLLVSLICLPVISWAEIGFSSDSSEDANIVVAMDDAEEAMDDADAEPEEEAEEEADAEEEEPMDDADLEPEVE